MLQDLNHKHLFLTATIQNPPTKPEELDSWLLDVVDAVGMKILIAPKSVRCDTPGNEGVTGICAIETSHVSAHCWEGGPVPFINADLYSCKDFDPDTVIQMLSRFNPINVTYMVVDRNDFPKVIDKKDISVRSILSLLPEEIRGDYIKAKQLPAKERLPQHKKACAEYNKLARKFSPKQRARYQQRLDSHAPTINCIKRRAQSKGLQFDLDVEWYKNEVEKAKIRWPKLIVHNGGVRTKKYVSKFWVATVDKIDPTKGYIKSNCRIIPHALNWAKSSLSKEEFIQLIDLLAELKNDLR